MNSEQLTIKSTVLLASAFGLLALIMLLSACNEEAADAVPRKYGFPRIDFPAQTQYQQFESEACPFRFEYPTGGEIVRSRPDSCWVDIYFPTYDVKWHISARDTRVTGKDMSFHFEEHRKIIYKHSRKANRIIPSPISVAGLNGTMHQLYGHVGSPQYLFLYDSTETQLFSFSFYFNTALKNDSLMPVADYMKAQSHHLLETFRWK